MTRLLLPRLLLTLVLSLPVHAVAQTASPPVDCAQGRWLLEGAPAKVDKDADSATFSAEWQPILEGLAKCASRPEWAETCLAVRGHSDALRFGDPVVAALGSPEAAQMLRAKGRATSVISRLTELGIPSNRVREEPALREATFRGVELWTLKACKAARDAQGGGGLGADELRTLVRSSVVESFAEEERRREASRPAPSPYKHTFLAEGGLELSALGFAPSTSFGPALNLGAGWRYRSLYARLGVGFAVGTADEQRLAFDLAAGAGYFHAPWLQLGVVIADRVSSSSVLTPWLEQSLGFGFEGTHCLTSFSGFELCARETVLPLGARLRRGEVVSGQPYRVPETWSYALRLQLGALLQRRF